MRKIGKRAWVLAFLAMPAVVRAQESPPSDLPDLESNLSTFLGWLEGVAAYAVFIAASYTVAMVCIHFLKRSKGPGG